MKNNKIIALLISLFILSACTKEQPIVLNSNDEDSFNLKNGEAIMPVIVRGNTASKVFCIVLHGGPGDSGIQSFVPSNVFSEVEKEYAMVYYDQRCAGLSQGNCDAKALEVSDFVEDIDKLITLLKFNYGDDISLFLLGHSWGATLGIDYLINGALKNEIRGMIQSNGSHNIPKLTREQRKFMLHHAQQQIGYGNDTEEWQTILDRVELADTASFWGKLEILGSSYQLEKMFIAVDSVKASSLSVDNYMSLAANSFITLKNSSINDNRPFYDKLVSYDVSDQLPSISTPIAFYWGWYDAVHPPAMVKDMYARIGSADKELHFFTKSFHSPFANENDAYQAKVLEFIKRLE